MEEKPTNLEADKNEEKIKKNNAKATFTQLNQQGVFGTISEPRKSLSSFFRNQNKFEVNAISVLDRKAAIIIKICTTLISGLIVFSEYIEDNVIGGNLITLALLIGLLASLILSVIAIKPNTRNLKKIVKNQVQPLHPNPEETAFYFWSTSNLKEYEEAMEKVIKSQDLQLGNQIRAHFILGRNSVYRAKYIDYSYSVFLASFVIAGSVFLISRIFA